MATLLIDVENMEVFVKSLGYEYQYGLLFKMSLVYEYKYGLLFKIW